MFPSPRNVVGPAPRLWRERAGRALGLAVAFLTLDEASGAPAPAEPPHPHRRPLRSKSGSRRPGAGSSRLQLCTAPAAGRGRLRPAGRAVMQTARRP